MRLGATLEFEDCMSTEFRIVNSVFKGRDFYEGVRAVILDKDNRPRWQPAELSEVSDADIEAYFAPLGDDELELG
jgi:enoyl-CoA hydratase